MKTNKFLRTGIIILVLCLSIGLDQLSKVIVRKHMEYYDQLEYLHKHFTLRRVDNTGAFLSLGDSLSGPVKTILLNILPLVAVLYGLYFVFTKPNLSRLMVVCITLIIGGGAGNLYDRIVHGSVTDFMYINWGFFHTGVFNIADMAIMAGMIILLLNAAFKTDKPEEAATVGGEKEQV